MGGTFDRLHAAHERLLQTAARIADLVFVGVVGETLGEKLFPKKQHNELIQPFTTRQKVVASFLGHHTDNFVVEELNDPWGPAPIDKEADVIVVSNETKPSADKINSMRLENGLPELDIVIVPWVVTESGEILSSSLLRTKEADEQTH